MKYTQTESLVDRLVREWKAYGKIIIDYDYDNTLYDYHDEGLEFGRIMSVLRTAKALGAHCYCFTSCGPERHEEIKKYLKEHDIPCDGINTDQRVVTFGGLKPYYNILLDDRAGLGQAVEVLEKAIEEMRIFNHNQSLNEDTIA